MKVRNVLKICLSALLIVATGCGANKPAGLASSDADSSEGSSLSSAVSSSKNFTSSTPSLQQSSGSGASKANVSSYKLQLSGKTPTGVAIRQYVLSGRDLGNSPDEIDEAFLSPSEGWKACWGSDWMMDLYKTDDGGNTWEPRHQKLLIKDVSGIIFLNRKQGYISFGFTPAYGWISLNTSTDGGVTWGSLKLTAPSEYKDCTFYTFPPIFFSARDGLILTHFRSEQKLSLNQLVFVTHDAGKNWKAAAGRTSDGDLKWDCVKLDNDISHDKLSDVWRVTFGKQMWQTQDGTTWEAIK